MAGRARGEDLKRHAIRAGRTRAAPGGTGDATGVPGTGADGAEPGAGRGAAGACAHRRAVAGGAGRPARIARYALCRPRKRTAAAALLISVAAAPPQPIQGPWPV